MITIAVTTTALTAVTTIAATYYRGDCDGYYRADSFRGDYDCDDFDDNCLDDILPR